MNEYVINSRVLTTRKPIEQELVLDKLKNYIFDLSYMGVLELSGAKALEFLQGQLTCDVQPVTDDKMVQGIQCNLKGRTLALLDVVDWQGIKLVLPQDMLELSKNSLTKTAILSRVGLEISTKLKVFGFLLQNDADLLPFNERLPTEKYACIQQEKYCCYHLGQGFYIFLIPQELSAGFCKPFSDQEQILGSLTWHSMRLEQGIIDIYPETRGLYLPHRLGFHNTDLISFNKGCYKGQEIIARLHYRSTIKHELKIEHSTTPPTHSTEELVDYSYLGGNNYVLAQCVSKEQV